MKKNTTNSKMNGKAKVPSSKRKSSTTSFRILSSTEIRATRNSAYEYLK